METLNNQSSPTETSFNDAPLDSLLDTAELVHNLSDVELANYVKRCAVLRSSAQSMKAAINAEAAASGGRKRKEPKKDSVSQALDLLSQLTRPS